MRNTIKYFLFILLFLVTAAGCWTLARYVEYKFNFEYKVRDTICETVKHEYLNDPKYCNESKQP